MKFKLFSQEIKLFEKCKDGGPVSTVDGYFLIEVKNLFSIVLLRFGKGSRSKYHTHAFNALTWFIKGDMCEEKVLLQSVTDYRLQSKKYRASVLPKLTKRNNLHKVWANKVSWALSLRGPWTDRWLEFDREALEYTVLTHGRKVISVQSYKHVIEEEDNV